MGQGKYEEADSLHEQILMNVASNIGVEHPEFASRLNNRGIVLWKQVSPHTGDLVLNSGRTK